MGQRGETMSQITDEVIAYVKGMLARGDKQQSIVACFGGSLNPGRIAEIANGSRLYDNNEPNLTTRARDVDPAPLRELPPPPPYRTPYELALAEREIRRIREALIYALRAIEKWEKNNSDE
jgi:hypothetical protein